VPNRGAFLANLSRTRQPTGVDRKVHGLTRRVEEIRTSDLRRAKASWHILACPRVSGDQPYLQVFMGLVAAVCPPRTSLYRPGCSTVAVRLHSPACVGDGPGQGQQNPGFDTHRKVSFSDKTSPGGGTMRSVMATTREHWTLNLRSFGTLVADLSRLSESAFLLPPLELRWRGC
jgi:hypothetical protein